MRIPAKAKCFNGIGDMKKNTLYLLVSATLLASCQTEMTEVGRFPKITAEIEAQSETRTQLSVDESGSGTIYWKPSDRIDVFFGTTRAQYISLNQENAATAEFQTADNITGVDLSSTDIWGLYPSNASSSCDGNSVTTSLPSRQYGIPDTFDDDLFITLAHSNSTTLQFRNVCSGIKFSLSREDIVSVTFRGNNDEDLAGDIDISFENDIPKASAIHGVKEIILTPKNGQAFDKDVNYYIIALPVTLSQGFTMTFLTTDGTVGILDYVDKPITLRRSYFSRKMQIDTFATFEGDSPSNNVIYYTSDTGMTVNPYISDVFGARILSNEYVDGRGMITFDGDVTSIGNHAFYYCSHLTSIVIPESVTSIGISAFDACNHLTSIVIPDSVESLGDDAFYNCVRLVSAEISSSVTMMGNRVFSGCSRLSSITVDPGNPVFDSRNDCNAIIETKGNVLIAGCKDTIIPGSVTSIGKSAFYHCTNLASITIPESVTSIGDHAFFYCSGLSSITIPNSVTRIEFEAFTGCSGVTSVRVESSNPVYDSRNNCHAIIETRSNTLLYGCRNTIIPNTVTSIGSAAFAGCDRLTSIEIPDSVTSINDEAFESCTGLTSVTVLATTPPALGSMVFDDTNNCPIYVPFQSVADYKKQWSRYANRIQSTSTFEDLVILHYSFDPDSFGFTGDGNGASLVTTASGMEKTVYGYYGLTPNQFHTVFDIFYSDYDYGWNIGTVEESYDSGTGEAHFLRWTISDDEAWENAGRRIQHAVLFANSAQGFQMVIILEADVDAIPNAFNVTLTDYVRENWNSDYSATRFFAAAPDPYDEDDSHCVFVNDLNAPFNTWSEEDHQGTPGMIKLDPALTDVSYYFCRHDISVPKIDGKSVSFRIDDDGLTLYAIHNGTMELIASIDNYGSDILNSITLNKESELARKLLNTGQFYVNIGARGYYYGRWEVNILFNGQDHFRADYVRPIFISTMAADHFIEGVGFGEKGTYLSLDDLFRINDWQGLSFDQNDNFWSYYGPFMLSIDFESIQCDLNGTMQSIPSTMVISFMTLYDLWNFVSDPGSLKESRFGFVTYKNEGAPVTSFNIYMRCRIVYGWGDYGELNLRIPVSSKY